MIAAPPSEAGAVKLICNWPAPAVTELIVGSPGAVFDGVDSVTGALGLFGATAPKVTPFLVTVPKLSSIKSNGESPVSPKLKEANPRSKSPVMETS